MPSVLVIDDSRLVAQKLEIVLGAFGIQTHHASSAAEVFGYRGMPSMLRDIEPDLIVLDIMMPDMSGFDTLNKLQSMVKMRDIPVVMFTASSSEYHVIEAMSRGAKAFVSKPLDRDKFLSTVARVAKETGRQALARCLANFLETGVRAETDRPDLKVGDANLSYLLEIIDGDAEMLHQLVQVFSDDMPSQLGQIEAAIRKGDSDELRRSAHLFKGSVANFGAALLTDKALQLEIKGRKGDLTGAMDLFHVMKRDAEELRVQLMAWVVG